MDIARLRLPDVTDSTAAPFWAGTQAGEIRVQQCGDCGYLRWPPAPLCPQCLAPSSQWTRLRGVGTVLSYCVYHRALAPAFGDEVPYAVAYVQLADGPRVYGQVDVPAGLIDVGQAVRAVFRQLTPDVTVICWAAAPAPARQQVEGTTAHEG